MQDGEDTDDFVRALARGLSVIEAFDRQHPVLTLTEVANRTGVSRATARRLLLTLTTLGYVSQTGRHFALKPRVLRLGFAYLDSLLLTTLARPFMDDLVAQVQESCSMAVLDGTDIVFVARVQARRLMSINLTVGSRLQATTTSMGRVLLAALPDNELDAVLATAYAQTDVPVAPTKDAISTPEALKKELQKVARQGWALIDQELEVTLRTIAVPVYGPGGAVVAAMTVATHAAMVPRKKLVQEFLPALLATAEAISEALRLT